MKKDKYIVWARIGAYISLTMAEAEEIDNNPDTATEIVTKAIINRGFTLGGDSYIPHFKADEFYDGDDEIELGDLTNIELKAV